MYNNYPTVGPLSPTISRERQMLDQAQVPPGQEQMAAAAKGMPIGGELAQLIQLNRALQQQSAAQQQSNPNPPTVAQDLMQRAVQQLNPQMGQQQPPQMGQQQPPQMGPQMGQQQPPQMMPQGIASLPTQVDPRQQGVAALPQEAVGRGMATGGIVAFNGQGEFGSLVPPYLNPLWQDGAMADDYFKDRRNKELERLAAQRDAALAARPKGIATLGAPPVAQTPVAQTPSDYDLALKMAQTDANKSPEDRQREREALEQQYGITSIRKTREDEMARREAALNPAAQNAAFWNNLSKQWASQIGQRGPLSSRLAGMAGAYGSTKSETAEKFKTSRDELKQAQLDVQERNAIARMTGATADRQAAEAAQKHLLEALQKKETADRLARQQEIAEQHNRAMEAAAARTADISAKSQAAVAEHYANQDATAKERVSQQLTIAEQRAAVARLNVLDRLLGTFIPFDQRAQYAAERADLISKLGPAGGSNAVSPGASVVSLSNYLGHP